MKNNGSLLILFVFLLSAHTLTAPQAHAGGYHNGTYYGGANWEMSPRFKKCIGFCLVSTRIKQSLSKDTQL